MKLGLLFVFMIVAALAFAALDAASFRVSDAGSKRAVIEERRVPRIIPPNRVLEYKPRL